MKKKLSALVGAAAAALTLALGLATPAYAEDGLWTSTSGITSIPFNKIVTLINNDGTFPSGYTFEFKMEPATVSAGTTANELEVVAGEELGSGKDTVTISSSDFASVTPTNITTSGNRSAKQYNKASSFDISGLTGLESGKVYRYTVKETKSGGLDLEESDGYVVDLYTSTVNGTVKVVAATAYHSTSKKLITFNNTNEETHGTLRVNKTFAGSFLTGDETATISITLSATAKSPNGSTFTATYSTNGTTTSTKVITVGTAATFEGIKNGGYITVDLPSGMSYTVKETGMTGFTATATTVAGTEGSGNAINDTHEAASGADLTINHDVKISGNTETITNTKDTITVTGVATNVVPFAVVAAAAVAGIVVFSAKKRNSDED